MDRDLIRFCRAAKKAQAIFNQRLDAFVTWTKERKDTVEERVSRINAIREACALADIATAWSWLYAGKKYEAKRLLSGSPAASPPNNELCDRTIIEAVFAGNGMPIELAGLFSPLMGINEEGAPYFKSGAASVDVGGLRLTRVPTSGTTAGLRISMANEEKTVAELVTEEREKLAAKSTPPPPKAPILN